MVLLSRVVDVLMKNFVVIVGFCFYVEGEDYCGGVLIIDKKIRKNYFVLYLCFVLGNKD